MYVAAGTFVGFESLALIIGYSTMWPVAVPVTVGVIAIVALAARWLRSSWAERAQRGRPDTYRRSAR